MHFNIESRNCQPFSDFCCLCVTNLSVVLFRYFRALFWWYFLSAPSSFSVDLLWSSSLLSPVCCHLYLSFDRIHVGSFAHVCPCEFSSVRVDESVRDGRIEAFWGVEAIVSKYGSVFQTFWWHLLEDCIYALWKPDNSKPQILLVTWVVGSVLLFSLPCAWSNWMC